MKTGGILVRVLVWSVVLFLFLAFTGGFGLFQPLWILFTGWISFLTRVVPQMTVNWSGIGMGVVCSALLIAGMHWLCQWLYAHWTRQGSDEADTRWRWTWTASLYGGLWLLFLAAMGVTGVVHQVGWLAASKEPLYIVRSGASALYYLRTAVMNVNMAGEEEGWKPVETRRAVQASRFGGRREPRPVEDIQFLYLEERAGDKLAAVILFYRDPKKQERLGFTLITPDGSPEEFKMDQLQTVLQKYQR